MKHARKLMALLLALVMLLSLSVTAFAATGDSTTKGSITINNTVKDTQYSIYRIFDLESFDSEKDAYSYKVNEKWKAFFETGAKGLEYVTVDSNGYVTWKGEDLTDARAAAFAKDALAYATAQGITADGGPTAATADNTPVEFTNLPLGYYLVNSSLGALCALTTTNPDATVIEKNANPTLTKEVQEGENWGSSNDAGINDTVNFRATITVQGTAKDYVMHDTMDIGLTFGDVTGVTLNDTAVTQQDNYTVNTAPADKDTFDVTFTENFCNGLASGDVIVVTYTATLNSAAVQSLDGKDAEENNAHLSYKDNSGETHTTIPSTTKTYTFNIDIFKYYMAGATETPLAGAQFTLSTDPDGENTINFAFCNHIITTEDEMLNPGGSQIERPENDRVYYRVAVNEDRVKAPFIVTFETGKLGVKGLDSGTYYLTETEAPAGYNKLAGPIKVVIDENGNVTYYNYDRNDPDHYGDTGSTGEVKVLNQAGTELPTTGGMGTTIFYVVGSVLLLGAAVLLVTKKRMGAAK